MLMVIVYSKSKWFIGFIISNNELMLSFDSVCLSVCLCINKVILPAHDYNIFSNRSGSTVKVI